MPPPTSQLEITDRTRISRAALPPLARLIVRVAVLGIGVLAPLAAFAGEREVALDVEGAVQRMRSMRVIC